MQDKKNISVDAIIFTDRYKVSSKVNFAENQIPWIDGRPPEFIKYDCKLWKCKDFSLSAYFYHEVESFVNIS
jgi:hypothetical protein